MKFKFRRYYLYYWARVALFLVYLLPPKAGLFISKRAGSLAYWILAKYRNIAVDNLRFAFGNEKTEQELRAIARRVFENLAKNAFELISFQKINKYNIDNIVRIRGKEVIDRALRKGKGAIVITGHFGNWELISATIRLKGYKGAVIGRRIYFDKYDRYLNHLRKLQSVDVIYRDESPRKALKVLKANGIIGILADQDVDSVEGVFVDFLGKKAYTPAGPAALAKASGAELIPIVILRDGERHTIVCEEPIGLEDTGDKEKDLIANTEKWSKVLESYIRRYPEHWVWMHRRWKTRPDNLIKTEL